MATQVRLRPALCTRAADVRVYTQAGYCPYEERAESELRKPVLFSGDCLFCFDFLKKGLRKYSLPDAFLQQPAGLILKWYTFTQGPSGKVDWTGLLVYLMTECWLLSTSIQIHFYFNREKKPVS